MTPEECKRLRGLMCVASGDVLLHLVLGGFGINTANDLIAAFEAGQKLRAEKKGLLQDEASETIQKLFVALGNSDEPELLTDGYPVFQKTFLAAAKAYLTRVHGEAWFEDFERTHPVKVSQ
jgi:hypothetical protein